MTTIPLSVIIPTRDRAAPLARAVESLLAQSLIPDEFVIVDASQDPANLSATRNLFRNGGPRLVVQAATQGGAAVQRQQAKALASHAFILFCDDDIICEPDCVEHLWSAMQSDAGIGGAGVAIVNQSYRRPGRAMRMVLGALGEPEGETYAGRIIGPAIGFLPDLSARGTAVPVQWLTLGCALYRTDVLPDPLFAPLFQGYSIAEDMALSLSVAKRARLVNVPAARVYHDSQPGAHKADAVALARMDVVNRHYVMTHVLNKRGPGDAARLLLWDLWQLAISAWQQRGGKLFWQRAWGKALGLRDILHGRQ